MEQTKKRNAEIERVFCAISNDLHVVFNPVSLSCEHFLCDSCIPASKHNEIKCKLCGKINSNYLFEKDPEKPFTYSKEAESLLEKYNDQLFETIQEKYENALIDSKHNAKECVDSVQEHFQYVKDRIELRLESLKIELDKIREETFDHLDQHKDKFMMRLKETDFKFYENGFKELKNNVESKQNLTAQKFYEYQQRIKHLRSLNKILRNPRPVRKISHNTHFNPSQLKKKWLFFNENPRVLELFLNKVLRICKNLKAVFEDYDEHISKSLVGEVYLKAQCYSVAKIKKKINCQLSFSDYCMLNDTQILLSTCWYSNTLMICNEEFEITQTISTIYKGTELIGFGPYRVCSNLNDKIYILDWDAMKILLIDYNFNLLKNFTLCPQNCQKCVHDYEFCYSDNALYISQRRMRSILKLSSTLTFEEKYEVDFEPGRIYAANGLLCAYGNNNESIYFYYLSSFHLKYKYEYRKDGCIVLFRNIFYEFDVEKLLLYCYNETGERTNEINVNFDTSDLGFNGKKRDLIVMSLSNTLCMTSLTSRQKIAYFDIV